MTKPLPVFDRTRNYGDIMHGDTAGVDVGQMPRYLQDGHYFRPDGSYHSVDGSPRPRVIEAKPVVVDTLPSVAEAEVEELLKDPRAEELLALTRDTLIELVMAGNGPMISGERSTQMMVAWLIKNTAPDSTPKPVVTPAPAVADSDL